jgi:dienelactone hydrolase
MLIAFSPLFRRDFWRCLDHNSTQIHSNQQWRTTIMKAKFLFVMTFIVVLGASVHHKALADEEVDRIEILTFESMTLTDQQFLQGIKDGTPVTIAGELRFPRNNKMKQYPVVLLVHGSGGISGYVDDWARELNKLGVAVFILDSFSGRGLYKINNDQGKLGRLAMIVDAYRALDVLAKHERIDSKRIAIMGFSRGGQVALDSSFRRFWQIQGTGSGSEFAAYFPFYPACMTRYKDDENVVNKPIHIFHGSADNYAPVAPCRGYVSRVRNNGKNIVLHEYAGAHHVFDYKKLVKPIVMKKAPTTRNCVLAETTNGQIVNAQSGKPFTYSDPCVEYGPTIAFNENAYNQAKKTLTTLISSIFELN